MAISNNTTGYRPGVCTFMTRPTAPYEGQMIYETDTNRVLVYEGAAWVMIADTDSPPGLELVKTQTVGSAVASVTVSNVFSSTYDNYKILYSGGVLNTGSAISMQLGPSSVATYNDNYETGLNYGTPASSAFAYAGITDRFNWLGGGNASMAEASFELYGPNLPRFTRMHLGAYHSTNAFGNSYGTHRATGQYTEFTLAVESGVTMTGGTIRVYGYRNAI